MLLKRMVWLLCCCLLGCQTLPTIPHLPSLAEPIQLQLTQVSTLHKSLLIIEPLNQESWRFIQLDALGAPLARQVLVNGQWRNDGFLPPNREASRLFSAVYAYLAIKRHWPVPEGIQVKIEKVEQGEEIRWQEQQWRVKELEDE